MAYLKNAASVSGSISASVGVVAGGAVANDPKYVAMLDAVHAEIESMLETRLDDMQYTDTFKLPLSHSRKSETLRLEACFVAAGTVVVTDSLGVAVNSDDITVDYERGLVTVENCIHDKYTVAYRAGFAAASDVYQGTPTWLRAMVDPAAVAYLRAVSLSVKVADNVSLPQSISAARCALMQVARPHYRPRGGVRLPASSVRTAVAA